MNSKKAIKKLEKAKKEIEEAEEEIRPKKARTYGDPVVYCE